MYLKYVWIKTNMLKFTNNLFNFSKVIYYLLIDNGNTLF